MPGPPLGAISQPLPPEWGNICILSERHRDRLQDYPPVSQLPPDVLSQLSVVEMFALKVDFMW